jgi:hypothetical protein
VFVHDRPFRSLAALETLPMLSKSAPVATESIVSACCCADGCPAKNSG